MDVLGEVAGWGRIMHPTTPPTPQVPTAALGTPRARRQADSEPGGGACDTLCSGRNTLPTFAHRPVCSHTEAVEHPPENFKTNQLTKNRSSSCPCAEGSWPPGQPHHVSCCLSQSSGRLFQILPTLFQLPGSDLSVSPRKQRPPSPWRPAPPSPQTVVCLSVSVRMLYHRPASHPSESWMRAQVLYADLITPRVTLCQAVPPPTLGPAF